MGRAERDTAFSGFRIVFFAFPDFRDPGRCRSRPGPAAICGVGGRPVIPSKQQYKIADVCGALDIQPYVLQYWQTEFPALASKKSVGSRQEYDAEDLETVRRIKELLYDEGYTIASAKKKLAAELDEGGVRGRPLVATEVDAPQATDAPDSRSAGVDASGVGEIGALTRRVERLEGGVAALVSQARQLAAELKPEMGVEDD